MFANKLKTEVVIRVLLIVMIFFNPLTSSAVLAQAKQGSISVTSPNTPETKQENRSIPITELPNYDIEGSVKSQQTADTKSGTSTMFIENVGQFDPRARFQAQGNGATIYFADDAIWFTLLEPFAENPIEKHHKEQSKELKKENQKPRKGVNLKVNLVGSNPHPKIESFNRGATSFSYFTGSDPSDWHSDVPVWGGIRYVDIYPGMDLEISGEQDHLVWDFMVTDASRFYDKNNQVSKQGIRIRIAGHQKLQVQKNGLDISTEVGTLNMPVIRMDGAEQTPQIDQNGEIIVPLPSQTSQSPDIFRSVNYIVPKETNQDEFAASQLNSLTETANNMPLSAPEDLLLYSTLLGGNAGERAESFVMDQNQNVYVVGTSYSSDFPVTPGVYDSDNLNHDGFVAKIDITNGELVFVTHLGGGETEPSDVDVDSSGNVYIAGNIMSTNPPDFAITPGVLDEVWDSDAFVMKLNSSGSQLIYSTYLGGDSPYVPGGYQDFTTGIEVDDNGFAYITGVTENSIFAETPVGYDQTFGGVEDVFVTKINPTATEQVYFTYLGGNSRDRNWGMSEGGHNFVLDASGAVYLTGETQSSNFPTTLGAYDRDLNGGEDVFALKLDPSGTTRIYSTFLGSGEIYDLAVDNSGAAGGGPEGGGFAGID